MRTRASVRWIAVAASATWLGCASTTAEYVPAGDTPLTPYEEAASVCEQEARFRSSNGVTWTDQEQYAECMEAKGWVKK